MKPALDSNKKKQTFSQVTFLFSLPFLLFAAIIIIFTLKSSWATSPQTTVETAGSFTGTTPTPNTLYTNPANSQTPGPGATGKPGPIPTAVPTTPLPTGQPGQAGNWTLIFSDEFNGSSLDPAKWVTCYWWDNNGCTNAGNKELEWYLPGNVEVGQGLLYLRAQKQVVQASDGKTYNYTSGMVTTGSSVESSSGQAKFAFEYGYLEVRAKIPYGKSLWPTVWLLPVTQKWPPEIDIMELVGDYPHTVNMTTHFIQADGTHGEKGGKWSGPDFSAGFHTFGLDWTPQGLTWYIDGVARQTDLTPGHIPAERMYPLLNLAVGGNWPGDPDPRTIFPSAFEIDYVRVWQASPYR